MGYKENTPAVPRRLRLRGINAERLAKAADETASVEHLRLLAGYDGRHYGRARLPGWYEMDAVAANPNTPLPVVLSLAERHSAAICRNPVLPVLPLEAPEVLWDMARNQPDVCGCLLREPDVPASVVALLAGQSAPVPPRIREEAHLHIARAGELSPGWVEEAVRLYWRAHASQKCAGDWIARQACIEMVEVGLAPDWITGPHPWPNRGAVPTLEHLVREAKTAEEAEAIRRAADPDAAEETLRALVEGQCGTANLRLAVAQNPAASPRLLQSLCSASEQHQMAVALNPAADAETLRHLLKYAYFPWIRRFIWQHPAAAGEVRNLARYLVPRDDRRCPMRLGYYRTPLADLAALLHPEASERARRQAACSVHWWKRLAAALSLPSASGEALLRHVLARDGNRLVRAAAKARQREGPGAPRFCL